MFTSKEGYLFTSKGSRKECDGEIHFRRHTFSFKSRSNNSYIVEIDEFDDFLLCVIKFYLKAHRFSKNKFQLLTSLNESPSVITTCINIMEDFYKKNPFRSFGFIGMNSFKESEAETKRFRIYRKIMCRVFQPIKFIHLEYVPKSVYLLLNRDYLETNPSLVKNIEDFFYKHYLLN